MSAPDDWPRLMQCRDHGIRWFEWDESTFSWRCPETDCPAFVTWEHLMTNGAI